MGALAKDMWSAGIRTLILESRDRLTEQTAASIRDTSGLEVDIEKGDQRASPHAPIVVACVPSMAKIPRLTGFAPGHFGCVIPDETHLALAPSWLRIIFYHHYGAESLAENWVRPDDGKYRPKCSVVGFTASPNLSKGQSLSTIYQHTSVNYSYLDAIEEGWLVGLKEINVPVRIDTRRFRVKKTSEGNAFNVADQNEAYTPEVIEKLAKHYVEYASDRKGMIFVPSVEIARQMSDAIGALGLRSCYVSGECIDKNEKTDAFAADGPGSVLVNCTIYTFGIDFSDVSCVAPFGAMISKVKYIQSIYRGTRVLDGVLKDGMTQEERLAAIAASRKRETLVLSPFFISDRIDICEAFDLFAERTERSKKVKAPSDFTKPAEIRDYIAALEKAANKHANKQPRTINPVAFALAVGDEALAHYVPETAQEAKPPTAGELDFLLAAGLDTTAIKSSGEAQRQIARLMERDRLGLAKPGQLNFLLKLGMKPEQVMTMKAAQAGAIIGRTTAKWAAQRAGA
jgi:superfamily II DNA or RNA helicase